MYHSTRKSVNKMFTLYGRAQIVDVFFWGGGVAKVHK